MEVPNRLLLFLLLGCATCAIFQPAGLASQSNQNVAKPGRIDHSTQLIVVTTPSWDAVGGTLQRYERETPADNWHHVGQSISVVVGQRGMGWGIGLAPIAVRRAADPLKHEGDHKSPAGIFSLGTSFGLSPARPAAWNMPYLALNPGIECVDDAHSKFYNRVVDRKTVTPDWNSSEHMRSIGKYYRWGIVINQNPENEPQKGSCVFLHVWGGDGEGTEGCTAMDQSQIESILAWLRPSADPLLVQMPLKEYRQAEKSLHLPSQ